MITKRKHIPKITKETNNKHKKYLILPKIDQVSYISALNIMPNFKILAQIVFPKFCSLFAFQFQQMPNSVNMVKGQNLINYVWNSFKI